MSTTTLIESTLLKLSLIESTKHLTLVSHHKSMRPNIPQTNTTKVAI